MWKKYSEILRNEPCHSSEDLENTLSKRLPEIDNVQSSIYCTLVNRTNEQKNVAFVRAAPAS